MTDYPDTHPYRYEVEYTFRTADGERSDRKEMAFTSPQDVDSIQARDTDITVTRVGVLGGRA